ELESPRIQPILQLTARDRVDQAALLPSFLYYPHSSEGALALPWNSEVSLAVGQYARRRAAESPGRVVASSKSWLSHPLLDRHQPVLPVNAAEDVNPVSPVEAALRLLEHLSEAWSAGRSDGASLGDQE